MMQWTPGLDWLRQVAVLVGLAVLFGVAVFAAYELFSVILHLPYCVRCKERITAFFRRRTK